MDDKIKVNKLTEEKILRNLDKICLDPLGNLANAELLASSDAERHYQKGAMEEKEWWDKIDRVKIDGEEIDLQKDFFLGSSSYYKIKLALINEIKQNPQDWKIEKGGSESFGKNNFIIKHNSGRRHWKIGIDKFWAKTVERNKNWSEIEEILKNHSQTEKKKPPKVEKASEGQKAFLLVFAVSAFLFAIIVLWKIFPFKKQKNV